ncbi:MAG: uracil-DNA glycosylase [Candidatus Vogelbacteria bacterium]|nr:uracil-DNA glycosylase [Candidatus Vogelbacteria bacterium]
MAKEEEKRYKALRKIKDELLAFKESPLYEYRIKNRYFPVVGEGSHFAKIMFVGEAPGRNEAEKGRPFCGVSGNLLNDLLLSAGIKRGDVYITNIVKDRPPENRDPTPAEKELYAPFLDRQIKIIQPKVIAALGRHAMEYIMNHFGLGGKLEPISLAHGKSFKATTSYGEVDIVALYHPAVAIYNRNQKDTLIKDFRVINKLLQ